VMDDSDLTLLSRIRRGDSGALGIIFERPWPPVVRCAFAIPDSRDAAENIAQETFVRSFRLKWDPSFKYTSMLQVAGPLGNGSLLVQQIPNIPLSNAGWGPRC